MLRIPQDLSTRDVEQWLGGGTFYARKRAGAKWQLARLLGGGGETGKAHVYFLADKEDSPTLSHSNLRAHWPRCGAVNTPRFALYVQRQQRRQYRRTYNGRCVTMDVLGKWRLLDDVPAYEMIVDKEMFDTLQHVFEPEYPARVDDWQEWMNGRGSVALNPQITLVGKENPTVFYRTTPVGTFDGDNFDLDCEPTLAMRVQKLIGVM